MERVKTMYAFFKVGKKYYKWNSEELSIMSLFLPSSSNMLATVVTVSSLSSNVSDTGALSFNV